MARCSAGQRLLDGGDGGDDVGAGLALDVEHDGGLAVVPAGDAVVLDAADHAADVGQAHRGAVLVGDDERAVGVGREQLVVGADGVGLARAVEAALGAVDVGGGDGGAHVLEREAVGGDARRVDADADGGAQPALDGDFADAVDLAELRLQQRVGGVADPVDRDAVGGERQREDRRVGRVHLRVDRRVGQGGRQRAGGGVDRGLHVLRGAVDVAG